MNAQHAAHDIHLLRSGVALFPALMEAFDQAQHEVLLTTPYFVPGRPGRRYLLVEVQHALAVQGIDPFELQADHGHLEVIARSR